MTNDSKTPLRDTVLAELARGTHTEAFADGARWATQVAEERTRQLLEYCEQQTRTPPYPLTGMTTAYGDVADRLREILGESAADRGVEWTVKS